MQILSLLFGNPFAWISFTGDDVERDLKVCVTGRDEVRRDFDAGGARSLLVENRAPVTMLRALSLILILLVATAFPAAAQEPVKVRIGHFPNITHGQALVARQLARQGKGWFEQRLGPGVQIEWFVYNAGPSAMEAILAGSIDATYAGPNPVLNAHIRAKGAEIRVIAGAALGGAALVVRGDGSIA